MTLFCCGDSVSFLLWRADEGCCRFWFLISFPSWFCLSFCWSLVGCLSGWLVFVSLFVLVGWLGFVSFSLSASRQLGVSLVGLSSSLFLLWLVGLASSLSLFLLVVGWVSICNEDESLHPRSCLLEL